MESTFESDRRMARLAGALFILVCLPIALWEMMYPLLSFFIPQDPVATASNLFSVEFAFRMSIVSRIAGSLFFAFMMLMIYRLFRQVDKHLALLMLVPRSRSFRSSLSWRQ